MAGVYFVQTNANADQLEDADSENSSSMGDHEALDSDFSEEEEDEEIVQDLSAGSPREYFSSSPASMNLSSRNIGLPELPEAFQKSINALIKEEQQLSVLENKKEQLEKELSLVNQQITMSNRRILKLRNRFENEYYPSIESPWRLLRRNEMEDGAEFMRETVTKISLHRHHAESWNLCTVCIAARFGVR